MSMKEIASSKNMKRSFGVVILLSIGLTMTLMLAKQNSFSEIRKKKFPRFAYNILTESCLSDYWLSNETLGDESACDCRVYVNSYSEPCSTNNTPPHVKYIHQKSTWTEARNLLYSAAKSEENSDVVENRFMYHIFMDDDAVISYTADYLTALTAFNNTKPTERHPFREFEEFLETKQPAIAVPAYDGPGQNNPDEVKRIYKKKCGSTPRENPWMYNYHNNDAMFIAYHKCAVKHIFPMETKWDSYSWWISALLRQYKTTVLFRDSTVVDIRVITRNTHHRSYPRGQFPPDVITNSTEYFNGTFLGRDHLIPPQYRVFNNLGDRYRFLVQDNDIICGKEIHWGPVFKHDYC